MDFFDDFRKRKPKLEHTTTIVNVNKSEYDIYCGRPSKWGCPFTLIKDRKTKAQFICETRDELFKKYEEWLEYGDGKYLLNDLHELKDKRLACFCKQEDGSGKRCHVEVLIKMMEKYL